MQKKQSYRGGQGVKPLGNAQLSIGAKMHISNSVSTNLSIKTPSYDFWRAKKKLEVSNPPAYATPSIIRKSSTHIKIIP